MRTHEYARTHIRKYVTMSINAILSPEFITKIFYHIGKQFRDN